MGKNNRIRNKSLSRRTVLKGAGGVALALPFLEILAPKRAFAATGAAQRFVLMAHTQGTVFDTNGNAPHHIPAAEGTIAGCTGAAPSAAPC